MSVDGAQQVFTSFKVGTGKAFPCLEGGGGDANIF